MSQQEPFAQDDFAQVLEITVEPMYLSEIARKLDDLFDAGWNIGKVSAIAGVLMSEGRVDMMEVDYQGTGGQVVGSIHVTRARGGDREETKEWKPYTIVINDETTVDDVRDEIMEVVNPSLTPEDKARMITTLTSEGNRISKQAEAITQDAMARQFREYETKEFTDYNDEKPDFYVADESRRDFGIHVEVTVRYDNPIGNPYVDSKRESRYDEEGDIVILAPEFAQNILEKYELPSDITWHQSPQNQPIHAHRVPMDRPEIYRPFAQSVPERFEQERSGFPVILPDGDGTRELLSERGHVGQNYPLVDDSKQEFVDALEHVNRDFQGITESGYRNEVRESIEPLLWEFARPYRIEQYLIDSYWDRGKTQNEIGRMSDVSDRTISRWMSDEKWNIVSRGRNVPLSDETIEIWSRMYEGRPPFDQIDDQGLTGYEVQALYNQHPEFTLEDWESWLALPREERAEITSLRSGARDNLSYTLMLNDGERIFPSYGFIINTLRENGVNIEANPYNQQGEIFPTGQALEYMLNRQEDEPRTDDEVSGRELVTMKSSLEVETAEWFSDNEIPFGYEPFIIPGMFTVEEDGFNELISSLRDLSNSDGVELWESIYRKHGLDSEGDVGAREGLQLLDRSRIEPDFATYPDAENEAKSKSWDGWDNWDSIIEVGGLYGVGVITDWQNWYRASSVAHKELIYRLLDLWQDTYFVIPEGEGISTAVRNDPHYVIINPTQLDSGLEALEGVVT